MRLLGREQIDGTPVGFAVNASVGNGIGPEWGREAFSAEPGERSR